MNKLKQLRTTANLSLRTLSEYVDISYNTLHMLETEKRHFREIHLVKLCDFFDVTGDYLLGYSDLGIGVYFKYSTDNTDHEYLSLNDYTNLANSHLINDTILANTSNFSFELVRKNSIKTVYVGRFCLFRLAEVQKDDVDIAATLKARLNICISKLDSKQLEKVIKFIEEYIK